MVAVLTVAARLVKLTLLPATLVSKFVPARATTVPADPTAGVKPVIVGALAAPTTKGALLLALPVGVATVIGPVVAPAGTLVTILVAVAEMTVACVWLNLTSFWLAVELKPLPEMVTVAPAAAPFGVNPTMAT